jgi:hypothetical protein
LEVGAEGGFKLDLRLDCDPGRQDRDPGKQKLKGAVRTETYRRHYCQQSVLKPDFLLVLPDPVMALRSICFKVCSGMPACKVEVCFMEEAREAELWAQHAQTCFFWKLTCVVHQITLRCLSVGMTESRGVIR